MEQTVVERSHQETQKELGILFACAPGHWGELLHLAEFVMWNTPGNHGFSPRDLVHGWSLASPLERKLLPFELWMCIGAICRGCSRRSRGSRGLWKPLAADRSKTERDLTKAVAPAITAANLLESSTYEGG